jgi:hypothetical protein
MSDEKDITPEQWETAFKRVERTLTNRVSEREFNRESLTAEGKLSVGMALVDIVFKEEGLNAALEKSKDLQQVAKSPLLQNLWREFDAQLRNELGLDQKQHRQR